jgi:hypothetical protein
MPPARPASAPPRFSRSQNTRRYPNSENNGIPHGDKNSADRDTP